MTTTEHNLMLVTADGKTARRVREIAAADAVPTPTIVEHLDAMVAGLAGGDTAVAIVDIDPAADAMLTDLDPIIARFPATRFVVLASEIRQEWLLRAMQAGARHFVSKEDIEATLSDVVTRLLPQESHAPVALGGAIAVLGAGGGCGVTTIALNLAVEMQRANKQDALLIDLDDVYGGLGRHLGVTASYGVQDVLARGSALDAALIRSSATMIRDGVHLLASPATVEFDHGYIASGRDIGRMVRKSREGFAQTIIDGGRCTVDDAATLASATDRTILVFELNVAQVRCARAMYRALVARDVEPGRIMVLANRYRGRKESISLREAGKALGVQQIETLPNDYTAVSESINYGKTLAENGSRTEIRRATENLAGRLTLSATVRKSA